MRSLAQLAELLESNVAQVEADISTWIPDGVDPALGKDEHGRYLLLDAITALATVRGAAPLETSGVWWITTDWLRNGGRKVVGPFETSELASQVRFFVEKAQPHGSYYIDEERR